MMLDECWFIVNGIPIRYSVREHALITGLSCGPLPDNYDRKSSRCDFIKKHFGETSKIDFSTVEKKLEAMTEEGEGDDRLKIAVLYFLTSVIARKKKQTTKIDDFLVNIVDDLPLCRRFPWGSYTFKNCVAKIRNYVENQKGIPNPSFCFEGFYLGLERLAFESIPNLKNSHLKDVAEANNACPRMCKSHFVDYDLKGFPLERIYEHLGETKEIQSILEPEADEQHLVANIVENADYVDRRVTWNAALRDNQVVCWEDLYDRDVSNREIEMTTKENDKEAQVGRRGQVQKAVPRKKDDSGLNRLKRQLYRRIDQRVAEVGKSLLNPSQSIIEEREEGLGTVGGTDHFAREVLTNVTPMHPSASRSPTIPVIDAGKQKGTREILKCYLINPNGSKDFVAIGVRDPSRLVIHSVPVKPHEVVVTVSKVMIDIPVWKPKDDVEMLSNAVGTYIVWPKDSVLPYEDEDEEDKAEDKDNLYQSDQRNRVVNEENPGTRKRKRGNSSARETEESPQRYDTFQSLQPSYSPSFQSLDEPEQTGANQEDDGQLQLHQKPLKQLHPKPLKVYVRQKRVTRNQLVGNEQVALRTRNQLGNGRKKPYITQGGRKIYSPVRFMFATYK
ncbi:uncharacterized protein LOC110230880 [Arabidopsis lyrata subsp. lyrata]|uniref:uncharacterized protein LOC110230880 n=1 Tax=Arabidopsis lyrata subsp. lyrata TaxID=81972 RepID=UPI000A29D293|nr:uncharacterized protein LOC110230880 [Arabidopsis lyrata subsp. lyrata]|eukprot:XP_020890743.1 uncharacterized protein LOC110230880 [Arabidopsis lyrata subsp. lyrata]